MTCQFSRASASAIAAISSAATGRRGSASSAGVQRTLGGAGFGRRRKLRPRQIDLEEFVGRNEPAARVAIEQVVAAGEPEVLVHRGSHDRLRLYHRSFVSRFANAARSTRSAGLVLALHIEEGERAQRLRPVLGTQGAERLADFAAVVRAMHGDQRVERMIAERGGELELLLRRRDRVLDAGRAEMRDQLLAPACRSRRGGRRRSPRRSAPASTSRARRRRESPSGTPPAPCLRASPDRRRRT